LATWPAVVVPWFGELAIGVDGPAKAPTPTAATTAAVAIPAQSLLLIAGRPGVMVSRGSSVAKLLLLGSEVTYGWFMVAHPGAFPPAGHKKPASAGKIKI
jgi:hypothetical protein